MRLKPPMLMQTLSAPVDSLSTADWLEAQILSGRLAPGSRINLEELAAQRAVPWSEIREAILRLAGDGLAAMEEGPVMRVSPVSLADLTDLTATRIVVESETLRQSIALGDDAWAARVRTAFENLSAVEPLVMENPREFLDEWEACNEAFHTALGAACPLRRLTEFAARLHKQHQRYRRLAMLGRSGARDVHAEHLALYEAALARDPAAAADMLAQHIGNTVDQLANGIRDGSWFGAPLAG